MDVHKPAEDGLGYFWFCGVFYKMLSRIHVRHLFFCLPVVECCPVFSVKKLKEIDFNNLILKSN